LSCLLPSVSRAPARLVYAWGCTLAHGGARMLRRPWPSNITEASRKQQAKGGIRSRSPGSGVCAWLGFREVHSSCSLCCSTAPFAAL